MQNPKRYFLALLSLLGLFLTGCTAVQSQPLKAERTFLLSTQVQDAPTDFDYRRLRTKAEAVCPEGYDIQGQAFGARGELPKSPLQCAGGCEVTLQWKIHCTSREKEPFSIFGNF